jgi:hypothetical protein
VSVRILVVDDSAAMRRFIRPTWVHSETVMPYSIRETLEAVSLKRTLRGTA